MPKVSKKRSASKQSNTEDDQPPKIKKSVQSSLFGAGVTSIPREFFFVQKEVLLTDEIYNGRVPDDMLSCKCRRHVADMSATCDTVAGFHRHGAVSATQNQLTVPTPYVGIRMYVGRYTFSDEMFAKCVHMSPTCRDIRHFRGKIAPPSRHDTADICS
jgi:hypothetical protein